MNGIVLVVSRRRSRPLPLLGRACGASPPATALSGCVLDWEKPEATVETPPTFRAAEASRSAPPIRAAREWSQRLRLAGADPPRAEGARPKSRHRRRRGAHRAGRRDRRESTASPLWPSLTMNDIARRTQTPATITSATSTSASTNATTTTGAGELVACCARAAPISSSCSSHASYEIDFWGKNQDASNAARLLAHASRFDRDVVEISTIASVVNAYFQVLTAQDRCASPRTISRSPRPCSTAIKARLDVGTATALDFSQQEFGRRDAARLGAAARADAAPDEEHARRADRRAAGEPRSSRAAR